jgi:hypothetical protein
MFKGEAVRVDLIKRFNIAVAQATKDFTLYRELAPQNIKYDARCKLHLRSGTFDSLFQYDVLRTLATLTQGFGDGFSGKGQTPFRCEALPYLTQPPLAIVATLTEAIYKRKAVRISYVSLSQGGTEREIVPHSLVDSGLRWHVRAYDRLHCAFRDFVLTRIMQCSLMADSQIAVIEQSIADKQWQMLITLELVPHPNITYQQAIVLDYAMTEGCKSVTVRAAVAGYFLRAWHVDCSPGHSLSASEYQLWLRNYPCLEGVDNALLAPGDN